MYIFIIKFFTKGVQIVCAGQLGLTSTWRKGTSV